MSTFQVFGEHLRTLGRVAIFVVAKEYNVIFASLFSSFVECVDKTIFNTMTIYYIIL